MYHITKNIAWVAIIVALITPTLSTTNQDYTYKDIGLSHPLKIYNNIVIDSNKLEDIVHDMFMMNNFLDERRNRVFFPFHAKHPLLIQGYLRKFGIQHIPQDLIFVINTHIPNHRIQQPTYFFLPDPIIELINIIFDTFEQEEDYNQSNEDGDVDMHDNINRTLAQADNYQPSDKDIGMYDKTANTEEEELVSLAKENPETFKQAYSAYCTLKALFIEYDPEKKDYHKGFDNGLRHDTMRQYEVQSRKDLEQRDRCKQSLVIQLIGLNGLLGNKTELLNFARYGSTFQDIIDVINFANGGKVDNISEIEQYYRERYLNLLKDVPKKMNKNWSTLPGHINFYSQHDTIDQGFKYQLLDPNRSIALALRGIGYFMHNNGSAYFRIYFSTIPLIKNLLGGRH